MGATAAETILSVRPLGFPWETLDPFLFCVHHDDAYPAGNTALGPDASLAGRDLGQDFAGKDGWRMYHGEDVPGFPSHPHRGFETVTLVRRGLVDHSDSLGAVARFGSGDAQWLTAGHGIVHSEMFPLVHASAPNPLDLFQIWLNLPGADKLVPPHFSMLWSEAIPKPRFTDDLGRCVELALVAGSLGDHHPPPPPPPHSWAARPDTDVAIWTIKLDPRARWTLPAATFARTRRSLYFFRGSTLALAGRTLSQHAGLEVKAQASIELVNGDAETELLLLQGRPIGEPIVQHGPFVMNTRAEVQQAFVDFRQTGFGGWPFPTLAPVHPREQGRFARHADGREENA